MSTENTATSGAGEVVPAVVTQDPKGDALAYEQSKAKPDAASAPAVEAQPDEAAKAAEEKAKAEAAEREKQKSRTTSYIERLKAENAEMRRRLAEDTARQSQPQTRRQQQQQQPQQRAASEGPPRLEDYDYDVAAWQTAHSEWTVAEFGKRQTQAESTRKEQESLATYNQRLMEFVVDHPDFEEAVGSIDARFFSPELERAVIGHEKGPAIAYHLATNEDALWNLASIRPDLMPAAIDRLASRLGAAPAEQAPLAAVAPPVVTQTKPISQAPPPAPTVSGRAVSNVPAEKLTDDEWYKADREKRRKR